MRRYSTDEIMGEILKSKKEWKIMEEGIKSREPEIVNKKRNAKVFITGTIVSILALMAGIHNFSENRLSRLLDLGQKYLMKQDYEQAVLEFDKAIRVDPMSVEAYLGMAEAYESMKDHDKAILSLQQGYAATDNDQILQKLESYGQEYTLLSGDGGQTDGEGMGNDQVFVKTGRLDEIMAVGADDMLQLEELVLCGKHISGLNTDEIQQLCRENGFTHVSIHYVEETIPADWNHLTGYYGNFNGTEISTLQYIDSSIVDMISFSHYGHKDGAVFTLDVRDITMRDPLEVVLKKLGFSNADEISDLVKEQQIKHLKDLNEGKQDTFYFSIIADMENGRRTLVGFDWAPGLVDGDGRYIGVGGLGLNVMCYEAEKDACSGGVDFSFDEEYCLEGVQLHNH